MENMQQNNLIDTALQSGVRSLFLSGFLHLSKLAPQPLVKEEYLLTEAHEKNAAQSIPISTFNGIC
jgi:hypothetical protein